MWNKWIEIDFEYKFDFSSNGGYVRWIVRQNGQPHKVYTRAGGPYLGKLAAQSSRLPSGHPEAFFEAFA